MLFEQCLRSPLIRLEKRSSLSTTLPLARRILLLHTTATCAAASSSSSSSFPPRRPLLDSEITENFLKGSGPGGQKINKTSSAVQLIHHPTGIVVKYQDTRSREVNRKRARRLLQDRLEELELGPEARTQVKARERSRKKASSGKKRRRKYRALEREKGGSVDGEEEEEEEEEEGMRESNDNGEGEAQHGRGSASEEVEGGKKSGSG